MKEYLASLLKSSKTTIDARNLAREYLQSRILSSLQRSGAFVPLAFHGGTALRLLFSIPRYSEDLDFTLEQAPTQYDLTGYLRTIRKELSAEGYGIELKVNEHRTVNSAFVRFPGLLYELDLSPHPDQVLAIKLEIDTNPPAGAVLATTIIRRHVTLNLQHHDEASMLAGKLHAVLMRPYLKGRDLYDLLWYISDPYWPEPNLTLLNNALKQTGWVGPELDQKRWRKAVRDRLESADWAQAVADVRPFLASEKELAMLTRQNLKQVLGEA